jgi:hypothetical protein
VIPSQPTPAEAALIERIRPHLTPDLLQPAYRRRVAAGGCDAMTGQCAVATEALYFALGGRSSGYTPMSIQHEGGPHWYLRTPDGRFLDVTASQFRTPVPYPAGRGRGFPTPARGAATPPPSRRAALVLARAHSAVSSDPCSGGLTSSWLWALQFLRSAPSSRPRSRCLRRRSAAAAIFAESQELKSFAVSVQQRRSAFVYDACKRRPR